MLRSGAPSYEKSDDLQHIDEANEDEENEDDDEIWGKGSSLRDRQSTEPSTARRNSADSLSAGREHLSSNRLLTENGSLE